VGLSKLKSEPIVAEKPGREVARSAQVSLATVSRVARGGTRVSLDIAEKVRKAAQELGIELQRKNMPKVIHRFTSRA
jgi:hypothetical protein